MLSNPQKFIAYLIQYLYDVLCLLDVESEMDGVLLRDGGVALGKAMAVERALVWEVVADSFTLGVTFGVGRYWTRSSSSSSSYNEKIIRKLKKYWERSISL